MNKKVYLIPLISLLLFGCGSNVISDEPENTHVDPGTNTDPTNPGDDKEPDKPIDPVNPPDSEEEEVDEVVPVDSIQDMAILHAWNWRMKDIKARLKAIKRAGFGAIQISPMQPKVDKDSGANSSTADQWWKLYQPLAFKIAEQGESILGTRDDLRSLCEEAKKYNLKIIVDVVVNHLAGSSSGYNNQVYTKYPLHTYNVKSDDDDARSVVQGHIDLPDLDTSDKTVQNDTLNMLKDYLDVGVGGFRFDAAKHIETPDDGEYASDYWPTIVNGLTEYAKNKNYEEPYLYGEILNTPGKGRSFASYTKYMSICDNKQGAQLVEAVKDSILSKIKDTYNTGEKPDHLVLWAESHDTYANTGGYELTTSYSIDVINRTYAMQASRKDAATLYYARPESMGKRICSIDDNGGYRYKVVEAVNKFHNRYNDKNENVYVSTTNRCFINIRGEGKFAGATIVKMNDSTKENMTLYDLEDGKYIDTVSDKEYIVKDHKVEITFESGVSVLIPEGAEEAKDETYDSNVILKNSDETKSYLIWTWKDGINGEWKSFNEDIDALGVFLAEGDNYIIVEFPNGTTSSNADWGKAIKQTNDLKYNKEQIIYDCNKINWK